MQYSVVLVRPQGPINIGMICRLVANLGAVDVRLVEPACPVHTMEARMFAHHAADVLAAAQKYDTLQAAVADCQWVVGTTARRRRDPIPVFGPESIAVEAQKRQAQHVALVFGSEINGLTEDELRVCNAGVMLESPGPYRSYNLSQAVAITLYLATCAPAPAAPVPVAPKDAPIGQVAERKLVEFWFSTLKATGYFRRANPARFAPKLQRLVGRLCLTPQDMHTLWGMLAHFRGE